MTGEAISNQIYEFRLNKDTEPYQLEWKQVKVEISLFTPRTSFSACAAKGKIFIWGGMELH